MNTTIRKVRSASKGTALSYLTSDSGRFDKSLFSANELEIIASEIKKKSKLIQVRKLPAPIFLQIVDADNSDSNKVLEAFRKAGEQLTIAANREKIAEVCVLSNESGQYTCAFAEGMALANYQFLNYKSTPEKNSLKTISLVNEGCSDKDIKELNAVVGAVYHARDLVNEPAMSLNATDLSNAFKALGKEAGFKVTVLDKAKIKSLKMGGLLAVNMGSIDPPTFTIMEYKPARAVNKHPIVLVGKGVVYDTGGLSLKPTAGSMDYMKCDMAGGAAVGCIVYAAAKAKLPVHVIALVPATDNRPGGNAYTPGDVITMFSGATVEVLNTDAEGRLILADALHYAKRFRPELVMEFSTLTGAAANAIGHYGIVAMGDCSDATKDKLTQSGNRVYERLVEFPFWDEYDELLKSDIADMKNIGGAVAGAITAGRFLRKFTDYPYIHFDIAGPAFTKSNDSYRGKNGTGVGVRLVFDYLKSLSSGKK
ncbi:MAG TPA: leucyl aminopeptidase [Bacteroidia bacterium]|nr:leucyl aminopeptidase [Bacteroidia bacterium]